MRCHACPVRFYYERNEPHTESDRYAICKQVSYHLGKPLDPVSIWAEVLAVRPGIDPAQRTFLDTCITVCNRHEWKPADQTDVRVVSKKYGVVGMVDRIGADGVFSIVRAAGAMPFGTYAADRLRITGCAICLQEMTGKEVTGGFVEYIPDGVSRYHAIQPRDRRQFLSTLHKVRSIREGEVPHQPLNAPCNRCRYKERCESSGGRRLSDLM
ncbi:MAG: Dna2/Cas4 domain-containing protein [Methanoregula sp.]|nr:MAG: Dna2/Cas4 domain-containing protein [Methanoregula sp.]